MRYAVVYLLAAFATALYAGEEPTEQDVTVTDGTRITEYENNKPVVAAENKKMMRQELQERPVRMIVGGDSEDGVARKIIVTPR